MDPANSTLLAEVSSKPLVRVTSTSTKCHLPIAPCLPDDCMRIYSNDWKGLSTSISPPFSLQEKYTLVFKRTNYSCSRSTVGKNVESFWGWEPCQENMQPIHANTDFCCASSCKSLGAKLTEAGWCQVCSRNASTEICRCGTLYRNPNLLASGPCGDRLWCSDTRMKQHDPTMKGTKARNWKLLKAANLRDFPTQLAEENLCFGQSRHVQKLTDWWWTMPIWQCPRWRLRHIVGNSSSLLRQHRFRGYKLHSPSSPPAKTSAIPWKGIRQTWGRLYRFDCVCKWAIQCWVVIRFHTGNVFYVEVEVTKERLRDLIWTKLK